MEVVTYKLFRKKQGKLYPLYVEATREIPLQKWLDAGTGELIDETHVKASGCGGKLALRPGFHSCEIPFTDWIGKKGSDGKLYQRPDTVWCECIIDGEKLDVLDRRGLKTIPDGWYYFKTNAKQIYPWIISGRIFIVREITRQEVEDICASYNLVAQPLYTDIL